MNRDVRVFLEGADTGNTARALRAGMQEFLRRALPTDAQLTLRVTTCGDAASAYRAFERAYRDNPNRATVLLVDSEGPVTDGAWEHVRRGHGGVDRTLPADRFHLMVELMEAWLVADPESLKRWYGQGFNSSSLPAPSAVESTPKRDLDRRLKAATKNSQKGSYDKAAHAPPLLRCIEPTQVADNAAHCRALIGRLRAFGEESG